MSDAESGGKSVHDQDPGHHRAEIAMSDAERLRDRDRGHHRADVAALNQARRTVSAGVGVINISAAEFTH